MTTKHITQALAEDRIAKPSKAEKSEEQKANVIEIEAFQDRKEIEDESLEKEAEAYWKMLTRRHPADWHKVIAKAMLQFLLKKYPQLKEES